MDRCFKNLNLLNVDINSTIFENNKAMNGGAIYIEKSFIEHDSNIDNENKDDFLVFINNSLFINNKARYYGGAIFSNFEAYKVLNLNKVSFIKNSAYAGGAIYMSNNNTQLYHNYEYNENVVFTNNTSESHGNDYASEPHIINELNNLNIISMKSGETIKLKFNLIDKFNQIVNDISKVYSSIILSVVLDKENNTNLNLDNIKILGNICNFSNDPVTLNLKLSLDSKNKNIFFKNDNLKIIINDCKEEQIKMYKGKYYYCENPQCSNTCPISEKMAICVKNSTENTNNIYSNNCVCVPGYKGDYCQFKEFVNLKNQNIIIDTGFVKNLCFYIGMMLLFISFNFDVFKEFSSCSLNFLFKHCGILIIYGILLFYLYSGTKLGMDYKRLERLNLNIFQGENNTCESNIAVNNGDGNNLNRFSKLDETSFSSSTNRELIKNIEKELNFKEYISLDSVWDTKISNHKSFESEEIENLNKSISCIHSIYMKTFFFDIISLFSFVIFILIKRNNEKEFIQEYNGKWRYKCPLYKFELIMDIIELILVIDLLIMVIKIWNYTYVFKCLKSIRYSIIIWVTLGPLVNVILYDNK
ncbi:hypothetical protein BCR36DRAFT_405245 [Piromyces finnis]|uniref:EGF-like domain-containing protein n=1 Tax=Piromyces finnis TaxID=1754191 RepID=A0A1Y1V5Y7_9FUNG|nr:hypothetical protein BCR36DRAFT_405245 [Piromyces finnis]|eukprot:ORX47930.1 hypothetical protein BCR36DRAFT_405245 [Piromyces finnis]